jgi:hypothetical protein
MDEIADRAAASCAIEGSLIDAWINSLCDAPPLNYCSLLQGSQTLRAIHRIGPTNASHQTTLLASHKLPSMILLIFANDKNIPVDTQPRLAGIFGGRDRGCCHMVTGNCLS